MNNESRKKLLVADDREDVVNGLKGMLEQIYDVDTAMSGLEVMRKCQTTQYFGLLIDIRFDSGISGVEAAASVRATNKEIIIIVFSGYEYSDAIRRKVIEIGAQFMQKPLTLEAVQRRLGEQQ